MRSYRANVVGSNEVLLEKVAAALTFGARFRGLMLRRDMPRSEGLLIPGCRSVHTFLMRFPLDLAYLDDDNTVVKVVHSLKPWRLSFCARASSVLEMPSGRAREAGLQVGDRLELRPLGG
ncbi:MAG: DUF192 domain-containing protein [Candidatus Brocadiaceae bacterium]